MRVLILTSPHHIYSNLLVKKVLSMGSPCEVVGIIESTALLPGKSFLESLVLYLRKAGFAFFFIQAVKSWVFRILCGLNRLSLRSDENSAFFTFNRLLKDRNIRVIETADINDDSTREFIRSCRPDLILIVFFGLILKKETLQLATIGVINIHPSLLPKYRGLMPIFQAMIHNEKEAGISVHWVDEGIDSGSIIQQLKIPITNHDTEHSLYARLCVEISHVLPNLLARIAWDECPTFERSDRGTGSYYSIPSRSSIREFHKKGRRFFTAAQLFSPFAKFDAVDDLEGSKLPR